MSSVFPMNVKEHLVSKSQPVDMSLSDDAAVLQRIIGELTPVAVDARRRIISTVCTFFGLTALPNDAASSPEVAPSRSIERVHSFQFSENDRPSLKKFLHEKDPKTDIDRVACLAYYLAYHRSTPNFKTKDITSLNTEAAQRRFSNTAFTVENATKIGYLVPSIKGCKQISSLGEKYVEALPNREAALEVKGRIRRTGGRRTGSKAKPSANEE